MRTQVQIKHRRLTIDNNKRPCNARDVSAAAFVCLVSGSLWGKPMWGAWWVWDARLTSMLVLLFLSCRLGRGISPWKFST